MKFVVSRVDCREPVAAGNQPIAFVNRLKTKHEKSSFAPGVGPPPDGIWWTVIEPITLDKPVEWSRTVVDDVVRVPMHAYLTPDADMESLVGLGIQLGLQAMKHFPEVCPIEKAHLMLGNVWRPAEDSPQLQVWLGLTFKSP